MPEYEVEWVALARIVGMTAPLAGELDHLVARIVRQRAEGRKGPDGEIGGAFHRVRVPLRVELADDGDDVADRFGGFRLGHRRAGVERFHVAMEAGGLGRGELEVVDAERSRLRQDGVVDVGDVAHEPHRVAEVFEPADEQVVGQVCAGVPEVGRVVGRDAAYVDVDDLTGREGHDLALRGVEQSQWHGREGSSRAWAIAPAPLSGDGGQ